MKRFIILLFAMCSFTLSYSQSVEGLLTEEEKEVTEKTLDDAYLAIPKKLVNKKWYKEPECYSVFNSNGTGASVTEIINKNFSHPVKVIIKQPFRWKRNGTVLTRTWITNQTTFTPVEQDLAKLSARTRAEFKNKYAELQKEERQEKYQDEKMEIFKLTDDVFIFESYYKTYCVTKKKLDELIAKQKNE